MTSMLKDAFAPYEKALQSPSKSFDILKWTFNQKAVFLHHYLFVLFIPRPVFGQIGNGDIQVGFASTLAMQAILLRIVS